ncbi:MAG TPA: sulfate ABC transporter permease subunit CysW [Thermoanaerobaculia bacterium]|nr:sulfate ABC transporter permease subunit CysW [Thermoanaerobaculia bacterium]HQN06242.1 sulfate ABC transporter permease subunit CysW [Thermoanaerobaculia bacterium]HQP86113.1 sulfate ABC transporter permease subunit CysW [Thermoanaerobaculia bacterium]
MTAPRSREPRAVRLLLIGLALAAFALFLFVPLAAVFVEAFRDGARAWLAAVTEPDARHALKLTLLVAVIAVPVNAFFGLAAGWALGKFRFPGRSFVLTLVDLPFAVSPVVAGLVFVLLFGRTGFFGPWLADRGLEIVFALPGIVLATVFVTFPFVAREVVPLMQSQGTDEEEAARVLGAGFFTTFFRVTLPNVKWALLYGIVLCTARAVGEFGAVSVVSGHVRGETNTLPLHVETLYNEYAFQGAFAAASLLTFVALATMVAKAIVSRRAREEAP